MANVCVKMVRNVLKIAHIGSWVSKCVISTFQEKNPPTKKQPVIYRREPVVNERKVQSNEYPIIGRRESKLNERKK